MLRKTRFLTHIFIPLLALPMVLVSCDDDDDGNNLDPNDQSKPTFSVAQPTPMDTFRSGKPIQIEFTAEDPEGISEMKYEVHWAGDGHSHDKTQDEFEPWNFNSDVMEGDGEPSVPMKGETPSIPTGVKSGPYHVGVTAVDANANEESEHFIILIQDADNPMVKLYSKLNVEGEGHDHDHGDGDHDHGDDGDHDHGDDGDHDHDHGDHDHGDEGDHDHGDEVEVVEAQAGDTLHLKGKVSQMGKTMPEVHIHIRDHSNGAEVYEMDKENVTEVVLDEELDTQDWGKGEFHLTIEVDGATDQSARKEYHIELE